MTIDVERTKALLDIVESCAKHSGKLTSISNEAMTELLDMNESIRTASMRQTEESRVKLRPTPISPVSDETTTTETPTIDRRL